MLVKFHHTHLAMIAADTSFYPMWTPTKFIGPRESHLWNNYILLSPGPMQKPEVVYANLKKEEYK